MTDSQSNKKRDQKQKEYLRKPVHLTDPVAVTKLAQLGMTMPEVAERLNISLQTLHKHFKQEYMKGSQTIDDLIRGKIMHRAINDGYWPAIKYLARVRLGWDVENTDDVIDKLEEISEKLETVYVAEFGSVIDVNPEPEPDPENKD